MDHAIGVYGDVDISRYFGIFIFYQFLLKCSKSNVESRTEYLWQALVSHNGKKSVFIFGKSFASIGKILVDWALGNNSKNFLGFADLY